MSEMKYLEFITGEGVRIEKHRIKLSSVPLVSMHDKHKSFAHI